MTRVLYMALSERFKHSFKTALAVVLAYGFALWFDWDKPMWAAFAVILISMPTLEASLGKGGQRLWGTLLATTVALLLIAAFPQDRWWFMAFQAFWLAFCTYQMSSGRNAYLWFCAGFVSSIITANGGPHPVDAFSLAAIRTLETSLGIACFTVVFALLWPNRTDPDAQQPAQAPPAVPRAERLNRAGRVLSCYCLGFLLVLYVPAFPGNYSFLGVLAPLSIVLMNSPQIPPEKLVLPVGLSILFASPVYILLLPLLSGFEQLAIVIFLACFTISYTLFKPEQALARTFGLAFFAVVTGISNDQSYSFLSLANTVLMFSMVLLVVYTCSGIQVFSARDNVAMNDQAEAS